MISWMAARAQRWIAGACFALDLGCGKRVATEPASSIVAAEAGSGQSCSPGCDLSKDEGARDALQRTLGREVSRSFVRIQRNARIPELVSFWGVVYDSSDEPLGVMYACCLYRDPESSNGPAARVLHDLGWRRRAPRSASSWHGSTTRLDCRQSAVAWAGSSPLRRRSSTADTHSRILLPAL